MRNVHARPGGGSAGARGDFTEVARHRAYLVRRARMQIGDPDLAEDVVQEALVAAFRGLGRFDGRSSVRTWLVSILQHKIVDAIRDKRRGPPMCARWPREGAHDAPDPGEDALDGMHDPAAPPGPEAQMEARELFAMVEAHLSTLPPKHASAFVMREIMDHASADICAELRITSNNLFVMLHRTRRALRRTVEPHGYECPRAMRRQSGAAR